MSKFTDEQYDIYNDLQYWSTKTVEYHGSCRLIREYVSPGRKVLLLHEWPHTPEECCDNHGYMWIGLLEGELVYAIEYENVSGLVLICNGCGLDGT